MCSPEYFCPKKAICNKVMKVKNQVPTEEKTSDKIQENVIYPDNWLMKFHMKKCQIMKTGSKFQKKKKGLYKAQQYLEKECSEGPEK